MGGLTSLPREVEILPVTWGQFLEDPKNVFAIEKPYQNLKPCDYRAVLCTDMSRGYFHIRHFRCHSNFFLDNSVQGGKML